MQICSWLMSHKCKRELIWNRVHSQREYEACKQSVQISASASTCTPTQLPEYEYDGTFTDNIDIGAFQQFTFAALIDAATASTCSCTSAGHNSSCQ